MPIFLSALGWVTEAPEGNRLRWSVPVDEVVDGAFRGLPVSIVVERSLLPLTSFGDTTFFNTPSWPIPLDWWETLGDLPVGFALAVRLALPKPVQAIRFIYQGPENRARIFSSAGEVLMIRTLMPGQIVLVEGTEIAELEFLIGGATLLQTSILDLFAGHDAGVNFEQIAVLNPRATATMDLVTVEARLSGPSEIDPEQWAAFQAEIAAAAIASLPDVTEPAFAGIERWAQFSALLAVRWRYSLLYGFGFLDGPEAGPGTAADNIASDLLLQEMPTRPVIYRVRCRFEDGSLQISNPIVVPPMPASPLAPPQDLAYEGPRVRLFEGDEYLSEAQLTLGANDRRVRGVETEEEFGPSPILATAAIPKTYLFQSWEPTDSNQRMRINRVATLPFYDLPVSCRARSLDIWDRTSAWSMQTPPVLPVFEHSPLPPTLLDARLKDGLVTVFPNSPGNSFAGWEPDHAAANTPGTVLEVMQRISEPAIVEISLGQSEFVSSVQGDRFELFRAPFLASLANPERFEGGYLIAAGMRATIREIDASSVAFSPIPDGADTTAMPGAGTARLQQAPNHPDLFAPVTSFDVNGVPDQIVLAPGAPDPVGAAKTIYYALRVDMGIVTGGLGNMVGVIRHPDRPSTPPPFSVEVLGVDFYNRTMIRIRFAEEANDGPFVVTWADGIIDAAAYHDAAIEGDYGPQMALHGLELFESLSLPVQTTLERTVTFGVQAKTEGGYVSGYVLLSVVLPVYQP
ncbi:MAG: hypothetical protein H0X43_02335 [Nitrosospira sp.]|nr:hypothetical protein [Nitrosospira sp.]